MFSAKNAYFCVAFLTWVISNAKLEPCPVVEKLRVVPGAGWDALTNRDTKQLMKWTYDRCQLTSDDKFLIPDETVEIALGETAREKHVEAELFDHWTNYTTLSSSGFKVATNVWPEKFLPLFYSFSDDYQQMKSFQVKNETFTCRSQMRRVIYRLNSTSNATMSDAVEERFLAVIRAVVRNNTDEARHLAETIVSDYGTHYAKSIDVGTVIAMEDYLKNSFLQKRANDRSKILSASKLSLVEYKTGFSTGDFLRENLDSSLLSDYKEATLKKTIRFSSGLNWEEGATSECLAAIDRSGDVLSSLVTSSNFPEVSPALLADVREMFNDVIRHYYTRNVHRGCTRLRSSNFDFVANLDDGSCKSADFVHIFGGVYATFKRNPYVTGDENRSIKNAFTGTLSCPTNFESQLFYSYHYSSSKYDSVYKLFSCLASANASVGPIYLFGGFYSDRVDNIHTRNKSCPQFYTALALPVNAWSLCISSADHDLAKQYALHFGGFATFNTDFQCPSGYKKHFAAPVGITVFVEGLGTDEYGKVYYCLREQTVKNVGVVPSLIRFPFANE